MNLAEIQPTPCTCPGCGQPASRIELIPGRPLYECTPCHDREQEGKRRADAIRASVALWRSQTPQEYREPIDARRLHQRIARALSVDAGKGVALLGKSRSGKTRVGYELLRRAAAAGLRTRCISHLGIAKALTLTYDNDQRTQDDARALLADVRRVPVLLLDDIGKAPRTERVDAELMGILDDRISKRLLTHWTANHGSKWIEAYFGKNYGQPIVWRLKNLLGGKDCVFIAPEEEQQPQPQIEI